MKLQLVETKSDATLEIIIVKNKKISQNKEILKNLNFTGENETNAFLPESNKLYIGCETVTSDRVRIAASDAIKKLNTTNYSSASIHCNEYLKEIIEGLLLGDYSFDTYKSIKSKRKEKIIELIVEKITKEDTKILEDTKIIIQNVNLVRDFVNTTPEDFYPKIFAKEAKKIAKNNHLSIKVLGDKYFKENQMGAIRAVGRASRHDSKLIHLTYSPKNAKKKIVLVGKGLTYDSGGLSLKPSDFMVTMKMDKSGGCTVLGIINAVAQLNLPIEVHAIVGAVENMIGGNAYKPDDVLVAKNGKTIEVRNTDAEGRLVLADCLCYAQDEISNIDYILDYATLTGACVVGLGQYTTGIMGNNVKLNNKIQSNADKVGEYATVLHFNQHLQKAIKSKVADISNVANTRYGGAITAGMFLDAFIKDENKDKWVHCDIAGPAYCESEWGYNPFGASGAGVRFTIEFLKNL